jgi:hypothetical protein
MKRPENAYSILKETLHTQFLFRKLYERNLLWGQKDLNGKNEKDSRIK